MERGGAENAERASEVGAVPGGLGATKSQDVCMALVDAETYPRGLAFWWWWRMTSFLNDFSQ